MKTIIFYAAGMAAVSLMTSTSAQACACGCGIFDVGPESIMPSSTSSSGLSLWFSFDSMNQNKNWEGSSQAPAADNSDKEIKTDFYTIGAKYRINHKWTVMAELPIYDRSFTTIDDDGSVFGTAGSAYTAKITSLGDAQFTAMYTGFAHDMSTGIGLGIKLPTGDSTSPNGPAGGAEFDRDSLPGTGSTDLIASAYHVGRLDKTGKLSYFVQARYQVAAFTRDGYRPGNELDGAAGLSYSIGSVGPISKIAPSIQLLNSLRARDSGENADPLNSGYERVLIAPGVDVRFNKVRLYADIELPLYQHVNATFGDGGQLVASKLLKVSVAYDF